MGTARARRVLPGVRVEEACALWFDLNRRPSFIDGFARPARIDGAWPQAPGGLLWDALPGGRGRVLETVVDYEPAGGQRVRVEDEQLHGVQDVRFAPLDGGCEVSIELAYELKRGGAGGALADALFVRRRVGDMLRRTLRRFAIELEADRELLARDS